MKFFCLPLLFSHWFLVWIKTWKWNLHCVYWWNAVICFCCQLPKYRCSYSYILLIVISSVFFSSEHDKNDTQQDLLLPAMNLFELKTLKFYSRRQTMALALVPQRSAFSFLWYGLSTSVLEQTQTMSAFEVAGSGW